MTVGEAFDQIAEPNQGGQYRHHALFAEPKPCGIETVVGSGRPGHLAKGGHVGSGLRVCRFGVTETPVGGFANGPKGIPVLRTDAAPDIEVTGIADDRLGTQRPSLFEVLLDPRRLVVTAQRGVYTPSHDSGTKSPGSTTANPAMENQRDLIWPAHVQVISNNALKPHPACLWPVEYASVGNFKLAECHLISVSGSHVGLSERGRQTPPPAPEKALHGSRAEPLAGLLQCGRITASAESIVQSLVTDSGLFQLPFGPLMAIQPKPDRIGGVGIGFPERAAPFRIPEIKIEVVDKGHLTAPAHMWVASLLLSFPRP